MLGTMLDDRRVGVSSKGQKTRTECLTSAAQEILYGA